MNFLAHAWLSRHGSDDFLYGNLIADGVKGSRLESWPTAIASGIRHHRQVDAAIDRHAEVLRLLQMAPSAQRRFTGIALDLVWDHFLASRSPDVALVERCYQVLGERQAPERLAGMVPAMIDGDWLQRYADFDFTCRAIAGIGQRLRGPNQLAALTPWLRDEYDNLEAAFFSLWPDMQHRFSE
ncbi:MULTISPECIES: ACP phosphodiesterase [Salinicola]|uniref:ACP phosphodiesterase n=1 Tax=Salinicola socius TaxID=404433 RepID=A0A1Q8SVU1_9GAMM|nr:MULTISPECIES: ACP phosphodiesterase [Salinicola]OLO05539.1 ACP phosphodiesterase [Salinicola socius]